MECLTEKTLKSEQIQKAVGVLAKSTLEVYLKHWLFAPYVRKVKGFKSWHYEYLYCQDFLNNLYTYLINKRQLKGAKNLRENFKQIGMQLEYLEN